MSKVTELLNAVRKPPALEWPDEEYSTDQLAPLLYKLILIMKAIDQLAAVAETDRAKLGQIETDVATALAIVQEPAPEPPVPEPMPRYDTALRALGLRLDDIEVAIATLREAKPEAKLLAAIQAERKKTDADTKRLEGAIAAVAAKILPPQPLPALPTYRMRVVDRDANNRPMSMMLEPVEKK